MLFALFAMLASFGIGCGTQINAIAEVIETNLPIGIPRLAIGIVFGIVTAIIILGGIESIATVCEKLVPVMALFYVLGCIVILGTQQVVKDCLKEGLVDIFIDAGAIFTMPTCGPCLGGFCGVLADGERAVSTTNRNFVGRMGHVDSEVYLASPAVAAASGITGHISHPEEVMNK